MALIKTFLPEPAVKIIQARSRHTGFTVSQVVRDLILDALKPEFAALAKAQADTEAMAAEYEERIAAANEEPSP